jgi:transposase InsO family protein
VGRKEYPRSRPLRQIGPDLFSRKVVGWSMRPDMQRNLVIDAPEMAWVKRNPGKEAGLTFHSDRGSQYASDEFSEVLKEHGIKPSMSHKGNGGTKPAQRHCSVR